jgi:acyl carrier protein
MRPDRSEIEKLVELQLGVEGVRSSDRLMEDLGAESADLMNLMATLEERFGIEVSEDDGARIRTVSDLEKLVTARLGRGDEK